MDLKSLHEHTGRLLAAGIDGSLPVVAIADITAVQLGIQSGSIRSSRPSVSGVANTPGIVYAVGVDNVEYQSFLGDVTHPRQLGEQTVSITGPVFTLLFAAPIQVAKN